DQVKGALMVTAKPAPQATAGSVGVGQLNAGKAGELKNTPPNPNLALNKFLLSSGGGGLTFDSASWAATVTANASWAAAWWADASWAAASWADSSFEDAAEGDASGTVPDMSATDFADLQSDPDLALPTTLVPALP